MDHAAKWRLALATALAASMVGSAACSSAPSGQVDSNATTAPEAPTAEAATAPASMGSADTLVQAVIGEPESLDPAWTYETTGSGIEANIYDTLVAFNREKPDDFVPQLATEWKVSDDKLTYTFNVRPGVKFHAGGTLEPHDIAYSLQRALLQDRADGPMWLFLDPMLDAAGGIDSLVFDKAGMKKAEGATEELSLADAPAEALAAACQMVMDAVTADDTAGTVTIKVMKPTPWFPQLLSQPWAGAMDKEWMIEQGDWDGECANWIKWHDPKAEDSKLFSAANGTGPYKLGEWKKGESISLDANEDYWRTEPAWTGGPSGPAQIKHVVIQKVEEWGSRFAKLQTGEADLADVPRANIDQVEPLVATTYEGTDESASPTTGAADGVLKLFKGYPTVSDTVALFSHKINTTGENEFIGSGKLDGEGIPADFFSDVHVRKAFNYCFDWQTFITDALAGEGFQTRGPIIKGLQGYSESNEIYTFDMAKCKEEMDQAWDGKVKDTGFKMTVAYNAGNDARKTAAEILAQNLKTVDPKYQIEVIQLEWPTFLENMRGAKLPIGFAGWLEDYHDASNWVHPFMHSNGAYSAAQGFEATMQKQFDDLIDQGVKETDATKREAIYSQLQQLAMDNAIDLFLFQATGRKYMNKAVSGWFYNPLSPGDYYYVLSKGATTNG
jgi:peptide/nickel transport system substrate-binding protein